MSRDGFPSKNPEGLREKPRGTTDITGKSSTLGT